MDMLIEEVVAEGTDEIEALMGSERQKSNAMMEVAKLLVKGRRKVLADQNAVADLIGVRRRTMNRYIAALSEQSTLLQHKSVQQLVDYACQQSALWRPLLFAHHIKVDETQLECLEATCWEIKNKCSQNRS